MTIPTLTDPDFPFYARNSLGVVLGCVTLDELDDWAFLLHHMARWVAQADQATRCDYARFAEQSPSYFRSDLRQMRCELLQVAYRIEAFVDGGPA